MLVWVQLLGGLLERQLDVLGADAFITCMFQQSCMALAVMLPAKDFDSALSDTAHQVQDDTYALSIASKFIITRHTACFGQS